jgi:hypothetical protein
VVAWIALSSLTVVLAVFAAALFGYCLLLAALYLTQRSLIYQPDNRIPDPAAAGVPAVSTGRILTADGLSLLAWYAPPARPAGYVVLYLHGNGGNIAYRARRLVRFAELGWGVMLPEYRGYGGNPGTPSEEGLLEDARAALRQLCAMGVAPARTLFWGESLGTGLAVRLSTECTAAAVLLESPYTSLMELGQRSFRWVPVRLLLHDRFDSLSRIGAVRAPLFIMQGGRDKIVPPEMGRRLLASAPAGGELWQAAAAGHNDLADFGLIEAAADFVRRRCPRVDGEDGPNALIPCRSEMQPAVRWLTEK